MVVPRPYSVPLSPGSVAIQGYAGSNSHITCRAIFNGVSHEAPYEIQSYDAFPDAFDAVANGNADVGVIPVMNTISGKVPYVFHILQNIARGRRLHIVGEYYLPIVHALMTTQDSDIFKIRRVHSHMHALAQCGRFLRKCSDQFGTSVNPDTAGAARMVAERGDPTQAAIAPPIAAELYGLKIVKSNLGDVSSNTTRFIVVSRHPIEYEKENGTDYRTTVFIKPKRNVINDPLYAILKILEYRSIQRAPGSLEEYIGPDWNHQGYLMDIMGHQKENKFAKAFRDLNEICSELVVLGSFPTHHYGKRDRNREIEPEAAP